MKSMANTYTISLPDDITGYADKLAEARQLSERIADLLREDSKRKVKKSGEVSQ